MSMAARSLESPTVLSARSSSVAGRSGGRRLPQPPNHVTDSASELDSPRRMEARSPIFYSEKGRGSGDKGATVLCQLRRSEQPGSPRSDSASIKSPSRSDVENLEEWLTENLVAAAKSIPEEASRPDSEHDSYGSVVQKQLQVLTIGFNELVKQVGMHCADRGELLTRIWHSHWELIDWVMNEMNTLLRAANSKLAGATDESEAHRVQMIELSKRHAREMEEFEAQQTRRWGQRIKDFQDLLTQREEMLKEKNEQYTNVRQWFPNIDIFSQSILRHLLPKESAERGAQPRKSFAKEDPQAALQADLARLADAGVAKAVTAGMLGDGTKINDGANAASPTRVQRHMREKMDAMDAQLHKAAALLVDTQVAADRALAKSSTQVAELRAELERAHALIDSLVLDPVEHGDAEFVGTVVNCEDALEATFSCEEASRRLVAAIDNKIEHDAMLCRSDLAVADGRLFQLSKSSFAAHFLGEAHSKFQNTGAANMHVRKLCNGLLSSEETHTYQVKQFSALLGLKIPQRILRRYSPVEEAAYMHLYSQYREYVSFDTRHEEESRQHLMPLEVATNAAFSTFCGGDAPRTLIVSRNSKLVSLSPSEFKALNEQLVSDATPQQGRINVFMAIERCMSALEEHQTRLRWIGEAIFESGIVTEEGVAGALRSFQVSVRIAYPNALSAQQINALYMDYQKGLQSQAEASSTTGPGINASATAFADFLVGKSLLPLTNASKALEKLFPLGADADTAFEFAQSIAIVEEAAANLFLTKKSSDIATSAKYRIERCAQQLSDCCKKMEALHGSSDEDTSARSRLQVWASAMRVKVELKELHDESNRGLQRFFRGFLDVSDELLRFHRRRLRKILYAWRGAATRNAALNQFTDFDATSATISLDNEKPIAAPAPAPAPAPAVHAAAGDV